MTEISTHGYYTVLFANGVEKKFDADAANCDGRVFVLSKFNPKRRKLESSDTFLASEVAWAKTPTTLILGTGKVRSQ